MKQLFIITLLIGFVSLGVLGAGHFSNAAAQSATTDTPSSDPGAASPNMAANNAADPGAEPSWIQKFIQRLHQSTPKPPTEQDIAIDHARKGQYDQALAILAKLYNKDKTNQSVARDYATVLSWGGQNQPAVDVYESMPQEPQPDYLLATIGRTYRELGQSDKALDVYQAGVKQYPDNVIFSEGVIRCLIDKNDLDNALSEASNDIAKHGIRPEIAMAKRDDQTAVELGREKRYAEALAILSRLYMQHGDNPDIARDYLAILGWAGGHDAEVVAFYKKLPPGNQPDYVLEAVGHSYRILKQPEDAQAVYAAGMRQYPDNVVFTEGAIRSLVDQKKYNEALAMADDDIAAHGKRPEIVDIRKNILRLKRPAPTHHHKKKTTVSAASANQ
jgi:tetratricopeptide (TPR) repeat protein